MEICGATIATLSDVEGRPLAHLPAGDREHLCTKPPTHGGEVPPPSDKWKPVAQHRCPCGAEWTDPMPWIKRE